MNANLFDIPSLITIGDGNGGNAVASLREYLRSLISANSIATFMTHKAEIYGSADTGAVRVRVPYFLQSNAYTPNAYNPRQQMQVSEVIVPIDQERAIITSVDDFDLVRFQNSGAYQAEILGSIAKSIIADLNANFYLLVLNHLKENKQQTIAIADFSADLDGDFAKAKVNAYKFARFINSQKQVFDKFHLSLETTDITSVINSNAQLNLIAGLTTGSAGDKAIDVQVKGSSLVANEIYGQVYTVDNMVIGNTLPSGSSFSADEEFDFSNLEVVSIYAGAVAFANYVKSLVATINPEDLNTIIGSKYLFGGKVVLPSLVWAVVKDNSIYSNNLTGTKLNLIGANTNPSTLNVVVTPQSIALSDVGTISVSSSNEAVCSVAYANGKVTVTKVGNGTATITVSSDNGVTKAGTKEIIFA